MEFKVSTKDVIDYYKEVKGCHSLAEVSNSIGMMSVEEKNNIFRYTAKKQSEKNVVDIKNSLIKR